MNQMRHHISPVPLCEILWDAVTPVAWDAHFARIKRANLLQSRAYGAAMVRLDRQRQKLGLIKISGQDAGLVQILEAGILNNAVHGVILDRGPLWFEGFGGVEDFEAFLSAFRQHYPKRFGRRVRFIPEMQESESVRNLLISKNFLPKGGVYETIWLDLRQSEQDLRKNLRKNWRNTLQKAEQQMFDIVWDERGVHLPVLMREYTLDKARRGYDGPSPKIISALAVEFSKGKNMILGSALLDGAMIAAILIFCHGRSATYQVGWTSDKGRERLAHYLLLWRGLDVLKKRGIDDFDLGGINTQGAKGVTDFKTGLGGQKITIPGLYV